MLVSAAVVAIDTLWCASNQDAPPHVGIDHKRSVRPYQFAHCGSPREVFSDCRPTELNLKRCVSLIVCQRRMSVRGSVQPTDHTPWGCRLVPERDTFEHSPRAHPLSCASRSHHRNTAHALMPLPQASTAEAQHVGT